MQLQDLLAEKNPKDGDWVEIELTGFKQTSMGKMKLFKLTVNNGSRKRQSVPDVPPPPEDGDVPPDDDESSSGRHEGGRRAAPSPTRRERRPRKERRCECCGHRWSMPRTNP